MTKEGVNLFFAGTVGAGAISLATSRNVFLPKNPVRTAEIVYPAPTQSQATRAEENRDVRELFRLLADEWIEDTISYSDPRMALAHPAYHKVLAMGTTALPYIMEELANGDGARWLPALDAITLGLIDPIPPEHETDANLMCRDWLNWWGI